MSVVGVWQRPCEHALLRKMSQGASPQPLKNAFDILMSRKVQPQQPLKATGRQATKASAAKPKATTQTTPTPRKSSQSHKDSPATALTPSGKPAGVDNVDLTGSPSAQPRCAENALNSVALDRQIVETGHHGRGGGHAHGEEQAGPVSLAGASPASPQRAQQQAQQLLKQMNEAGHESLQQQQPHQQQQGDQGPGTAGGVEAGAAEPPSKRPKLAPPFRKPGARAFSKQVGHEQAVALMYHTIPLCATATVEQAVVVQLACATATVEQAVVVHLACATATVEQAVVVHLACATAHGWPARHGLVLCCVCWHACGRVARAWHG